MAPKWSENRLKMAPWRLLGDPGAALGVSLGAKAEFRAILGALGDPFWGFENGEKRS